MRFAVALLAACSYTSPSGSPDAVAPVDSVDAPVDVAAPTGPALASLQTGSLAFAAGVTTETVMLIAVDPARSFVVASTSADSPTPSNTVIACELVDASTLTCRRAAAAVAATVRGSVASFERGVSVQRGTTSLAGMTMQNVSLTAIDPGRSFPIITGVRAGNDFNADDLIRGQLASPTTLELRRQDGPLDRCDVFWQVIEYEGASVQAGTASFAAGDTAKTVTLPAAAADGWLLFSYFGQTGTLNNMGQRLVRGRQTDATTLVFDRDNAGPVLEVTWYHVVLGGSATVQHGTRTLAANETTVDVIIATVDPARSLATAGGIQYSGGKSPFATIDNPGVAMTTLELVDATTLRLQRAVAGNATADIGWYVVGF